MSRNSLIRFKVELNSADNLRDLLQEIYMLASRQITQAQDEMDRITSAANLQGEPVDGLAKFASAVNSFLQIKDKAVTKLLDLGRLMAEIMKHNGDVNAAIDSGAASGAIDTDAWQKMIDEAMNKKDGSDKKKIELKKQ